MIRFYEITKKVALQLRGMDGQIRPNLLSANPTIFKFSSPVVELINPILAVSGFVLNKLKDNDLQNSQINTEISNILLVSLLEIESIETKNKDFYRINLKNALSTYLYEIGTYQFVITISDGRVFHSELFCIPFSPSLPLTSDNGIVTSDATITSDSLIY